MIENVTGWQLLFEASRDHLRAAITNLIDPFSPTPAEVASLRKSWPHDDVVIALEWAAARRKATIKFSWADRLIADRDAVEQASDERVARHKAARFRARSEARAFDLCSGLGGDAHELVSALGIDRVTAWDHSPTRAWMTSQNTGVLVRVAAVEALLEEPLSGGDTVHLDPGRRDARAGGVPGRRRRDPSEYEPSLATCLALLGRFGGGALKLSPSTDLSLLPAEAELEIVAQPAGLLQLIVWTGDLRQHPGRRVATRWLDARRHGNPTPFESYVGTPEELPTIDDSPAEFVVVPHPALERANLVGAHLVDQGAAVEVLAPGLGWYVSGELPPSAWYQTHRVLARLPFQDRRVREVLAAHKVGPITVRTRGGAVDPLALERRFRGDGPHHLHLFVLRLGSRLEAFVTEASRETWLAPPGSNAPPTN